MAEKNITNKNVRNGVLVLMLLLALILSVFGIKHKTQDGLSDQSPVVVNEDENKNVIELCFAYIKVAGDPKNAMEDDYNLRMSLDKDMVMGEINYLPAEKDKKIGAYEGTVTPVDKMSMSRTIDAIWHTFGEGVEAFEKIQIVFGEGTAYIDGLTLNDVDCKMLDERVAVKEYLKKNIATLAPKPATLGGTWFYLRSNLDTSKKTGFIVYEDGHMEEKRAFTYELDKDGSILSLKVI